MLIRSFGNCVVLGLGFKVLQVASASCSPDSQGYFVIWACFVQELYKPRAHTRTDTDTETHIHTRKPASLHVDRSTLLCREEV